MGTENVPNPYSWRTSVIIWIIEVIENILKLPH
jgi:hypothetical protein